MEEKIKKSLNNIIGIKSIVAVYLHGSKAKGYALKDSDTDIAVIVKDKKSVDIKHLREKIRKLINQNNLDIRIVDKQSSPLFLFSLVRNGVLLYSQNKRLKLDFETFAMKNYYYTDRIRNVYSKYL